MDTDTNNAMGDTGTDDMKADGMEETGTEGMPAGDGTGDEVEGATPTDADKMPGTPSDDSTTAGDEEEEVTE